MPVLSNDDVKYLRSRHHRREMERLNMGLPRTPSSEYSSYCVLCGHILVRQAKQVAPFTVGWVHISFGIWDGTIRAEGWSEHCHPALPGFPR